MSAPRLVLVGAPGGGKSSVARAVAERLGAPLYDTDAMIAQAGGVASEAAFVDLGEERYRALERDAVATALAADGAVVALGSGALGAREDDERGAAARSALADARASGAVVVDLLVSLAAATPRMGLTGSRPVGLGAPRALLVRFAQERAPLYAHAATHTIDTDRRTPDEVVATVLELLDEPGGAGALS